jgi:hypothetical protein
MFCKNSYDSVNVKIKFGEVKDVFDHIKGFEVVLVQYGNVSYRILGSDFNYSIAKYQIYIWFDSLDEMEILFDELESVYTDESKSTIKLVFNDDNIIVVEKV